MQPAAPVYSMVVSHSKLEHYAPSPFLFRLQRSDRNSYRFRNKALLGLRWTVILAGELVALLGIASEFIGTLSQMHSELAGCWLQ